MQGFNGFLWFCAILAAWFVLNRWVLPRFGVPMCLCGCCAVDPRRSATEAEVAGQVPVREDREDKETPQ